MHDFQSGKMLAVFIISY